MVSSPCRIKGCNKTTHIGVNYCFVHHDWSRKNKLLEFLDE